MWWWMRGFKCLRWMWQRLWLEMLILFWIASTTWRRKWSCWVFAIKTTSRFQLIGISRFLFNCAKIISSMGSAAKFNPTPILIADISHTKEDALARTVRAKLRKLNIHTGIPVVYSRERTKFSPVSPLKSPEVREEGKVDRDEFAPMPNFRSTILPVLGFNFVFSLILFRSIACYFRCCHGRLCSQRFVWPSIETSHHLIYRIK